MSDDLKQSSPTAEEYLRQRGIQVIDGTPPEAESFPYISLNPIGEYFEDSEIKYHESPNTVQMTPGIHHPTRDDADFLVRIIERIATQGDNLSTLAQGDPLKVFVTDPAWKPVTDMLEAKYSN